MGTPSSTVAFANLGTSPSNVIAADSTRGAITFHNPNLTSTTNVSVLLYPTTDLNGNSLSPTFSAPGGGYVLLGGGEKTFRGADAAAAWDAVAASGSTNGLTMYVVKGPATT